MATITIVGLGPGGIDDMTRRAWQCIEQAGQLFLRTSRHPAAAHLPHPSARSFDDLYQQHDRFEDVYRAIGAALLTAAASGDVVYAVPGDPMVGEATTAIVQALADEAGHTVELVAGISFIEPMLATIGYDALDGLQIVDGLTIAQQHHPTLNPQYPALIAQVYSREVASDIKLTLMNQYPDEFEVCLVMRASSVDAVARRCLLHEIDWQDGIDHLTSLYLPALGEYTSFESFQETIAHLRAPEGCPWDQKQTHESLRPYLIEEAYEVLDAIDRGATDELAGELGDLLLQVVLHTQIAIDEGEFTMADVIDHVNRKMIRRHPHVWGDVDVHDDAAEVLSNWDAIKRSERADSGDEVQSLLASIPAEGPALWVAYRYQHRAAKVGFDWPDIDGVEAKVHEELAEVLAETEPAKQADEIGDLIFTLVNWLRWLGQDDPETLMRRINRKFYRRFSAVEQLAGQPLSQLTIEQMEALWQSAKRGETS